MKLGIFLICLGIFMGIRGISYYPDWAFMLGYLLVGSAIPIAFGIRSIKRRKEK